MRTINGLVSLLVAVTFFLAACAQTTPPAPPTPPAPTTAPAATTAPATTSAPAATSAPVATSAPAATTAPTAAAGATTAPAASPAAAEALTPGKPITLPMANPVPATVNSERVLHLPLRSGLGNGIYGAVTNSTWNLGTDFSSFIEMPLSLGAEDQTNSRPWLAQSWSTAPDCRSTTIQLRKEAKWSDGQPVTTKDVVFTLTMLYADLAKYQYGDPREFLPNVTGGEDYRTGKAKTVSGYQVIDDFNMKILFDAPGLCDPMGIRHLNFVSIVPEHALNKYTADQIWQGNFPEAWVPTVWDGPYHVMKFDKDQKYMAIQRDENWWGNSVYGKPNIKNMDGQPSNLANLLAGKTDLISLGFTDAQKMKDNKDFTFQARPWTAATIIFNLRTERILPKAVREAIMMAIDKQAWIQVQNLGIGVPLRTPFSWGPNQNGWCTIDACDPKLFAPFPYDPAKAKQMIQNAKWDSSRELVLIAGATDPTATLLQQELQAVGIKSSINTNPDLADKLETSGEYDIWDYGAGWPNNNPIAYCSYWVGDLATNYYYARIGWANEAFRTACNTGIGTADPQARQTAFLQAVQIYNDEVGPVQAWGQGTLFYAFSNDLGGFDAAWSVENWWGLRGPYGIIGFYWKK